jgi:hypothetical protein
MGHALRLLPLVTAAGSMAFACAIHRIGDAIDSLRSDSEICALEYPKIHRKGTRHCYNNCG